MIETIILSLLILAQLVYMTFLERSHKAHVRDKEIQWEKERQQLIDRIQAPSFAEFKQAEVKVIKAQKEEKPEVKFHLE